MKVYQSLISPIRFAQSAADNTARDKDNLDFLLQAYPLKDVKRTGWVNRKVREPETVASHCWGAALLALLLTPKNLDVNKVIKLLLAHDLAEVKVGDITPEDKISNEEKHQLEEKAMSYIAKKHPEIRALSTEYNAKSSPEAHFASQLDKLDILVQAVLYKGRGHKVDDIFANVMAVMKDPNLKNLAELIRERFNKTKKQPR